MDHSIFLAMARAYVEANRETIDKFFGGSLNFTASSSWQKAFMKAAGDVAGVSLLSSRRNGKDNFNIMTTCNKKLTLFVRYCSSERTICLGVEESGKKGFRDVLEPEGTDFIWIIRIGTVWTGTEYFSDQNGIVQTRTDHSPDRSGTDHFPDMAWTGVAGRAGLSGLAGLAWLAWRAWLARLAWLVVLGDVSMPTRARP